MKINEMVSLDVKNSKTEKSEEYRIIKISEDRDNEYFLHIKVPNGYLDSGYITNNNSEYGNTRIINFYKKDDFLELFRIAIGSYPNKSIEDFVDWRSNYIHSTNEVVNSLVEYGDPSEIFEPNRFKSALTFNEMKCAFSEDKICFPGQSEIYIMRAFQENSGFGDNIWDISYTSSVDGNLLKEERELKINNLKLMAQNCCEIISKEIEK
ncbi:MAG: hypothetical protein ACJAS6_001206 [Rickettsiales bacterium]|jgi:hypothetical protein